MINWLHALDQPIVAADIVEYNPRCDISNLTASVAAKLLKEIAGMMVKTARNDRDRRCPQPTFGLRSGAAPLLTDFDGPAV